MTENSSIAEPEIKQTVFVVEDDPAIGEALCDLFDSAGILARRFASAEEFTEFWSPAMTGCLLLDVRLPGMSGMELQARLVEAGVAIPTIIMTAHGDIPMVRKAFKAGAFEFLTKPFRDKEILRAVEDAFRMNLERHNKGRTSEFVNVRIQSLSERERQIVELVTTGITNREIAEKLYLSIATVKLYRRLAMEKMGADSIAELVKMWEMRSRS
jgi:FixJ family two-component response regulator